MIVPPILPLPLLILQSSRGHRGYREIAKSQELSILIQLRSLSHVGSTRVRFVLGGSS
jgi:hypothetical protein